MKGAINTLIKDKIARITFSHPASNSFPSEQLKSLAEEIYAISENKEVAVVVLQSEGIGAFCAGASFDELLEVNDLETGKTFFSGFANVINAMRKCEKIIIGRVQGKTVGGGVGLVSACDYTFATHNAAIKLSEIAIGIGPFVIEPAVSRKIGKSAMAEMTLSPTEWKSAEWGFQHKLYSKLFEDVETMDQALGEFVKQLAGYNPEALLEFKKVLWEGTSHWDELLYDRAAVSGKLVLSDFTKNALNAFKK
ncbi:enoyl-CoA hydratase/isomerase family protein [Flavobacterium columnare NBRC 100251 = ATCC 23463]|uniref:Enoyl-CoA hydratase/isomerase n=2 Tax=Flavobacterium columnare TaxID=996 RepID=G8X533_FLACA|nr:enoyl-CoA hydratase/isomerase family protein [Flavobacterium columnare]AEW87490.1 enoyl-CoA hydratase/isomerase [Flavobacterium columnare ATCC 49512]AMO20213.1 enoyl-CoA hydratase/isomerase family protein [Flavobacterium columnare]ANO49435.1 enoyl-CoA hydratase/isomerase [Flavobacterium columnare]APT22602.1 enoyl-CoA hydratase [Flavobacterium columnare]AUX18166.1 enoyl-CoA hydratase [Flavobacterium columnare]